MTRKKTDRAPALPGQTPSAPAPAAPPTQPKAGKAALVRRLLERDGGATLATLCAATGWQAHSARAMLSTLRKAGHGIQRETGADGATVYHLAPSAADAAGGDGAAAGEEARA